MDEPVTEQLVEKVEAIVRERMDGQAAGHGMDHVLRVLVSARAIQSEVGGELQIVELAALLHDVGDAKFHDGVERSAEFAREILSGLGAGDDLIEHVAHIVDNISFRKGDSAKPLSLQGQIVQDADRLDALGAIGIVRTIEYGAAFDQPFHLPDAGDAKTGVGHFHEKLFKLKSLMNTDAGRRMAEDREAFMRTFLNQFLLECGEAS
ncbi:HD domain-containing protein [Aporhodopirellula aestuarii]|uniref:HD domain-containing protein n=1 Tax=Aporhodopirellula aestuarii TaxID=2950107 RepID=A0ABT0U1J5_9BACT|nr:HD domain-containing protein [Aporhodopirellula aestuarii]MCM2370656.1 HD domain-containing protein [Aporhodopirellula aestuarii]